MKLPPKETLRGIKRRAAFDRGVKWLAIAAIAWIVLLGVFHWWRL